MPKPNKGRSNVTKPQNNDSEFSVGVQILQVHPRLVMTAEMLMAGERVLFEMAACCVCECWLMSRWVNQ